MYFPFFNCYSYSIAVRDTVQYIVIVAYECVRMRLLSVPRILIY